MMGQHSRRESYPTHHYLHHLHFHHHHPRIDHFEEGGGDLVWPYDKIDGLNSDDIRETAYEIFFTSCRSSPGFGGRTALTFYSNHDNGGDGSGTSKPNGVVMTPTSRVKRALGLKMLKRSPSRRMAASGSSGGSSTPSSPVGHVSGGGGGGGGGSGFNTIGNSPSFSFTVPQPRPRRPMTSAEIMRQQMRVTEQSDNRLRKTLMRSLVGQMGRKSETIILPLELLRHLKPSEFSDITEYHTWQKRQLKVFEAGLLLHPSTTLDKTNKFASMLSEIISSGEKKPIDTSKNSDTMRTLLNAVVSLSWRNNNNGTQTDVCHWADGYPLNIHLYVALLQSVFDIRDETLVLDEVDELLELMKKTWATLGITMPVHNLCFTWVLFQQYIATAQIESDLLCASHAMLAEVANDAKKPDREAVYVKILSSVLNSMLGWAEKRLLSYHDYFQKGNAGQIENLLPLVLTASRILGEDVTIAEGEGDDKDTSLVDSSGERVEHYVRSSIKSAFSKVVKSRNFKRAKSPIITRATSPVARATSPTKKNATSPSRVREMPSEPLLELAQETEDLAAKERESFSSVLKKWHPTAAAVAAVTLHNCYGGVLKQYLSGVSVLTSEMVEVLQRADKLEKTLVQMVVEDSAECEDGGKTLVREMVPYEVDSIISSLLRRWIDGTLKRGKEIIDRSKETETWNPKSKSEPYAQSAVELMKMAKKNVEEFFEIPIGITEDLVHDFAEGFEDLLRDYIGFVASCGSKQSYVPSLPPLTRCNRDSRILKLWKKASPCNVVAEEHHITGANEGHHPRPSTSRGTQRLYIRLNTLHYLHSQIQSLDKSLSASPAGFNIPATRSRFVSPNGGHRSYCENANSEIEASLQHVSEVAAYRLIFLDSSSVFYDGLYVGDVTNSRIRPALRILKQNLHLMSAILTDRAQAMAMKEVMKAAFEAFLMVLLAGGSSRMFYRPDHEMIQEDFESLKKVFCTCSGEGLIAEEVVEREAEIVEGVISLMSECTEQLMEDFSIVTCETSGIGVIGSGQKLPMPPTTGRWNRSDPNTTLRVLCYRNDRTANQFLKKTFQLAKRR